jgi:hypothetical protein
MLPMFFAICVPIKPPVRLSPLFGHLTQELSAFSGLDSWVNPDFVVINTPLDGPGAPLFLRFCC